MPTDAEEIFPHIERWKSSGQGVALGPQLAGGVPRSDALGRELLQRAQAADVAPESGGEAGGGVATGLRVALEERLARGERKRRFVRSPGVGERIRRCVRSGHSQ